MPVRALLQPALVLLLLRPQSQEAGGRVCWRLLLMLMPAASQALEGSLGVVGWWYGLHHAPVGSREEAGRPYCAPGPAVVCLGY